jgi:MFS family permease
MIGTPIAAVFFFFIVYGWTVLNFWAMFASLTAFNVSMAFYRAPVVALMPDLVPSVHRSKANGVINLMGGIGSIYAFAIASRIYKIQDPGLAAIFGVGTTQIGPILAFLTTSIIMVIAVLILYKVVKEPPLPPVDLEKPKEVGIIQAFRLVSLSKEKSTRAILAAIFFWFLAYNSVETWFTKYGNEVLGFATADASFLLNGIAISFVIFAVPAGFAAGKVGRRNAILTGLVIMIGSMFVLWFLTSYLMILGVLAVAGLGWALVNVNSIVMVWEQIGKARLGAATGLYYAFSTSAAIVGPFVAGVIFDLTTIKILFPLSIVFLVVALLITLRVKLGEVGDEAKSEVAQ